MNTDIRTKIIQVATFLGGLYFFIEYLIPENFAKSQGLDAIHEPVTTGLIVLGSMAIGLGLINLFVVHGKRVALQLTGWVNSAALLLGMFLTLVVTVTTWQQGQHASKASSALSKIGLFAQKIASDEKANATDRKPLAERVEILKRDADNRLAEIAVRVATIRAEHVSDTLIGEGYFKDVAIAERELRTELGVLASVDANLDTPATLAILDKIASSSQKLTSNYRALLLKHGEGHWSQNGYKIVYDGLFVPLGSAMFALLGVYIASAAFRAFRVRSFESALLMIAALLVMLGQISFGTLIYEGMPGVRQWLLEVPNSAAFRAIRFGAGVAGLLLAIRMWLSIESKSFAGEKR